MSPHAEAPRRGLGTWVTLVAGAAAAAILAWGLFEMARAPVGSTPAAGGTQAPGNAMAQASPATLTAAPAGTRLYREVFSVSDAVLHRGTWFVLDRRGTQVHLIDGTGAPRGSFGRGGEGPGELRRPVAIAARADTVIILDGADLHLFDLDGDHLTDRRVELGGCVHGMASDLLARPAGLFLLVDCKGGGRAAWMVVFEAGDGRYRTVADRVGDPGVVDIGMTHAVLEAHPRGFVFGLPGNDCLDIMSPDGTALAEACHDWIERLPIPQALEDRLAGLRGRARATGVKLVEPDRLPPFTRILSVGGEVAYQVPLPDDLETFRLVRRGPGGEAVALPLPPAEGMFGADDSVLLWWRDIEGTRIAIRSLDAP